MCNSDLSTQTQQWTESVSLDVLFLPSLIFWIVTVQHQRLLAPSIYNFDHEIGSGRPLRLFFNLLPLEGLLLPIKCWQDTIVNVERDSDLFSCNFLH